jgi:hypothetical protein
LPANKQDLNNLSGGLRESSSGLSETSGLTLKEIIKNDLQKFRAQYPAAEMNLKKRQTMRLTERERAAISTLVNQIQLLQTPESDDQPESSCPINH